MGSSMRFVPVLLLVFFNVFMTYAWYGHLKEMRAKPLLLVIALSWSIAFFEYCLQVPANRLGSAHFTLPQLKVMQEIVACWSSPALAFSACARTSPGVFSGPALAWRGQPSSCFAI